ncbi:hypothetical protein [Rhizobium leguminosarum]|uniref:hypothetical protein n=1 Tax=Rhizobium leguminosarum TaxID=384 RepID=UPI0013DBC92E|nr:hypothetical protein [Rhizobium leguminosarum]
MTKTWVANCAVMSREICSEHFHLQIRLNVPLKASSKIWWVGNRGKLRDQAMKVDILHEGKIIGHADLGPIDPDLPLNFHPAAVRASAALNTPSGVV